MNEGEGGAHTPIFAPNGVWIGGAEVAGGDCRIAPHTSNPTVSGGLAWRCVSPQETPEAAVVGEAGAQAGAGQPRSSFWRAWRRSAMTFEEALPRSAWTSCGVRLRHLPIGRSPMR